MTTPVVVFDLDDTLYLERDFAYSGFRAAAALYARGAGRGGLAERCIARFDAGQRVAIFDSVLEELAAEDATAWTHRLVEVYRGHRPTISLAPDAARWLARADARSRFGLITDGRVATQRAKIAALGLGRAFERTIITDAWGLAVRKPHPKAFLAMQAWAGAPAEALVYVADNPLKDFLAPRSMGWRTVRIARPDRVHHAPAPDPAHEADAVIDSLDDLAAYLGRVVAAPGTVA